MRKEFETLKSPLNMELVRSTACEMFLADGQQVPILLIQTKTTLETMHIPNLADTYEGQAMQMAQYGWSFAITHAKDPIVQLFFISEAWLNFQTETQSQPPKSIEILSIIRMKMDGKALVQDLCAYEIQRKADYSVDKLTEYQPPTSDMPYDSPILKYFMSGYLMRANE